MSNETVTDFGGADQASRIKRLSSRAKWVATAALFLFALAVLLNAIGLALDPQSLDSYLEDQLLPNGISGVFTPLTRILGVAATMATFAVATFGFYRARQLFVGYWRGEILTKRAADRIRDIGWVVFALAPVSIAADALGIIALTAAGPVGSRYVGLRCDAMDIAAIVFGLLFVIVGVVLREAARLSEENRQFV